MKLVYLKELCGLDNGFQCVDRLEVAIRVVNFVVSGPLFNLRHIEPNLHASAPMAHFLPQEEVVEAARAYEVKRLLENPRNQLWIEAMLFKSAVEPTQEVQKLVQGLGRVDVRPQGTGGLRGLPASTGSGSIDAFVFDDRWNDQRLQFLFLKNESSRMSSKSWTIWSTWTCSNTYATTWTRSSRPLFLVKHQFSNAKSQF